MRYLGKGSISSFLVVALAIAWYICLIGTLGMLVAALVVVVQGASGVSGTIFSLDAGALKIIFDAPAPNAVPIALCFFGLGVVSLCFALIIIHQLRRLFRDLCAEKPFTAANAGRIRTIGWLTLAGAVVQGLLGSAVGLIIMNNVNVPGVTFEVRPNLNLSVVFVGLVILVLAEVFRHGAALQEEQDLTV